MSVEHLGVVSDVASSAPVYDAILTTTNLSTNNGPDFQGFTFDFDDDMVNLARVIAGIIAVVWLVFAISKYASPSSKGGGGSLLQRIGGAGPLVAALFFIAALLDINVSGDIVNAFLRVGWSFFNLIRSGLPGAS